MVKPDKTEPLAEDEQREEAAVEPTLDAVAAIRERDEYLTRWQRAQADYQNLKRRTASEVEGAVRRSLEGLLQSLLLVLDHLELALQSPTGSEDAVALAQGVRLTRDQMLNSLRSQGVEPVLTEGTFDPNLHEAVATVETDEQEAGSIVDCLRAGYTWNGQVLRAAHVRVARAAPPASEAGPSED